MVHPVPSGPLPDADPTDPRAVQPKLIGRYELAHRLGAGGMAEVHLARAIGIEGFHKLVVLKRILPHLTGDPEFIRMFLTEARLAAMLDHPNIAQVFDLGIDGRDYYFVMEYVHGSNLQHILRVARRRKVKIELGHAVALAIGALAGLHYAHDAIGPDGEPLGLVHRDISPTNLLVTHTGHVKLVDFGIAKVVNSTDFTRAGTRKGKVPYMSPEQCQSGKLDRRSDIFSAGIVLYELTTMSRLFTGDNEFAIMNQIVHGEIPPPSTLDRGYHPALEKIVMRALERDPTRRYQSARDMQMDLERFARDRRIWATPTALAQLMEQLFDDARRHPLSIVANPNKPASDPSIPSLPSVVGEPASFSGPDVRTAVSGAAIPALASDPSVPSVPGTGPVPAAPAANGQLRTAILGALTGIGVTVVLLAVVLLVWPFGRAPTEDAAGPADASSPPDAEKLPTAAPSPEPAAEPEPETEPEPEPVPDPAPTPEADTDELVLDEPEPEPEPEPTSTPKKPTPKKTTSKSTPKKKKAKKNDSGGNLDSLLPG